MDEIQRRAFMKGAAIGALAFSVGGAEVMLTPRQAQAQNVALRTLTPEQAATLGAMGEALVPGAKDAGVVNFVDQQLSIPAEQALLEARIMNVRPPYANFYRSALGAIEGASQAKFSKAFTALTRGRAARLHRSHAPEQARRLEGAGLAFRLFPACAPTRSTSSTAPWMATPISACPISRISHRRRAGEERIMATQIRQTKKSMS